MQWCIMGLRWIHLWRLIDNTARRLLWCDILSLFVIVLVSVCSINTIFLFSSRISTTTGTRKLTILPIALAYLNQDGLGTLQVAYSVHHFEFPVRFPVKHQQQESSSDDTQDTCHDCEKDTPWITPTFLKCLKHKVRRISPMMLDLCFCLVFPQIQAF